MLLKILDYLQIKILWKSPERAMNIYSKIPPRILDSLRLYNLKNTLKRVDEKSIFYSQKFEQHPFDLKQVRSPADLGPIFTTPEDLQTRPIEHFLCGRPDTAFETTGTVSRNFKRIMFSNREIEDLGRLGAAGLWNLGVRPEDRVASSFDYSFWVSGPTLKNSLTVLKAFHVEAGRIEPEEFYERIKPYGCNVIVADPGWLVRLSEIADRKGPWLMKLIIIGGENLNEGARQYIEKVWQCKVLLSYGQTEAFGMVGVECSEQKGYHFNDMDLWPEIVEPDEEGYGELVYTTLRRSVMPLVRYRSGDVTRIIPTPCACGSRSVRLAKLKGRVDEMVVTSVGNIAAWMLELVVDSMEPQIHEWQLSVHRDGNRDRLEFRAESLTPVSEELFRDRMMDMMKKRVGLSVKPSWPTAGYH